jgi:hypothetical protein
MVNWIFFIFEIKVFISWRVAYEYESDSLQINDICMMYKTPSFVEIIFPNNSQFIMTENEYGVQNCTRI